MPLPPAPSLHSPRSATVRLATAAALGWLAVTPLTNAATLEVVATGLNNPRGINFSPDGDLYVAEAGSGGTAPCAEGPEGPRCYGESGAITRIDLRRRKVTRIATGLPSLAGAGGAAASGVHDIVFTGRGNAQFSIGFGGDPADRTADFGIAGAALATLGQLHGNRCSVRSVDLGAFELAANPTDDALDTNPYGLLALQGGVVVADAGGNALNFVRPNGAVVNLATFPKRLADAPPFLGLPPGTQIPMDEVPTCVDQGPDGQLYVGQLTGFPFPVGGANLYRVPARGGAPTVVATGFTAVIDLAFGPKGTLYVLEIAKNGILATSGGDWTGSLVRVNRDGTRTEIASEGLFAPGGLAIDGKGTIYVSNKSILPGAGEVLRIRP